MPFTHAERLTLIELIEARRMTQELLGAIRDERKRMIDAPVKPAGADFTRFNALGVAEHRYTVVLQGVNHDIANAILAEQERA